MIQEDQFLKARRDSRFIDVTGQKFGRLTVLNLERHKGKLRWRCLCDCGNKAAACVTHLRSGLQRSCGCLRNESASRRFTRHAMSKSGTYKTWCAMKARCYDPGNCHYPNYGGRGVVVCAAWKDSFEQFLADMGERPMGMSLDRKDNNGNYSPDNCRWLTNTEQSNNRRNNRKVTYQGVTLNSAQWADRVGISRVTLHWRLRKGWSVERALSQKPTRQKGTTA